jgi:hypothetical protein
MKIKLLSVKRQIKAQRYKEVPVTISLLLIPIVLSLFYCETIKMAAILLSLFMSVYIMAAFAVKKRRPLLFRPLLIAGGVLLIIVLEKLL